MRKTYPSTNSGLSRRILRIGAVLVFVFAGLVRAAEESPASPAKRGEQPQPSSSLVISSITVTGNRNISNSEVLSKVRSRVGQAFEAAKAAEDAKRIAAAIVPEIAADAPIIGNCSPAWVARCKAAPAAAVTAKNAKKRKIICLKKIWKIKNLVKMISLFLRNNGGSRPNQN